MNKLDETIIEFILLNPNVASRILDRSMAQLSPVHLTKLRHPNVVTTSETRKDRLTKEIGILEQSIDLELKKARNNMLTVAAAVIITVVTSSGAAVFSNPVGTVTTVMAGGSGTGGLIATSRDSLVSYNSLKSQWKTRILECKGKLEACSDDDNACLDQVQTCIDNVYNDLRKQTT